MHYLCEQNVDNNGILHTRLRHDLIRCEWAGRQNCTEESTEKQPYGLVKVTYQLSSQLEPDYVRFGVPLLSHQFLLRPFITHSSPAARMMVRGMAAKLSAVPSLRCAYNSLCMQMQSFNGWKNVLTRDAAAVRTKFI